MARFSFRRFRGGRGSAPLALAEDDSPDGDRLGAWAQDYRTGDPVRGVKRALRWSVLANGLQLTVLLLLAAVISTLAPLRRDVPYLLEYRGYDRAVAKVSPLRVDTRAARLIAERLAVRYVKIRHEVVPDPEEMNRRWGTRCLTEGLSATDELCAFISKHSTPEVYARFRDANQKSVQEFIEKRMSRQVTIDLDPIRKGPDQIEVRMTLRDYQPGRDGTPEILRTRRFAATVWYRFATQEVPMAERYLNPSGFQVVAYQLAAIHEGAGQ